MTREQVLELVRAHLADELAVDPARIDESTRFREDLEADSLDLYTLVQELEDQYGGPDLRRAGGEDPDRRPGGRLRAPIDRRGRCRRPRAGALTAERPRGPARPAAGRPRPAGVHALVVDGAPLGLLRAARLPRRQRARARGHHPSVSAAGGGALRRRPADEDPRAGGLRPLLHGGRRAARDAGAAARRGARRRRARTPTRSSRTERVLASVIEAVIGACYLAFGYETTAEAVVEAFAPEIDEALEHRSTSSRRCRSGWPAAASWSSTP